MSQQTKSNYQQSDEHKAHYSPERIRGKTHQIEQTEQRIGRRHHDHCLPTNQTNPTDQRWTDITTRAKCRTRKRKHGSASAYTRDTDYSNERERYHTPDQRDANALPEIEARAK